MTHASLWQLDAFSGATDNAYYWGQMGGDPVEEPRFVLENSPHLHVDDITTPMLVIHGDKDYRVPIGEGLRLYYDLVRHGVEAKFLYFPTENHWVLTPGNAKIWYETVFAFLAQHVLGESGSDPSSSEPRSDTYLTRHPTLISAHPTLVDADPKTGHADPARVPARTRGRDCSSPRPTTAVLGLLRFVQAMRVVAPVCPHQVHNSLPRRSGLTSPCSASGSPHRSLWNDIRTRTSHPPQRLANPYRERLTAA